MSGDSYIDEAVLKREIKAAWDAGRRDQQLRMLDELRLPRSVAGSEMVPEHWVHFPEPAGRSLADRWGKPDFVFIQDGVVLAWIEVKLTASPDSLKLAAYALALSDAPGRLLSPFAPGWKTYPVSGAPQVEHVSLDDLLAVLSPTDELIAIAVSVKEMLAPSLLPAASSLDDLLSAMPGWWRAQDMASGAVLSAEMERVGLRSYVRSLDHWGLDADILGSPTGHLCDRSYFSAFVWFPGSTTWDAVEMQFHRPKRQRGSLAGVRLFVVSGSDDGPAEVNEEWLKAGRAMATDLGWVALGATTSTPSSGEAVTNEALVFEADRTMGVSSRPYDGCVSTASREVLGSMRSWIWRAA